MKKCTLLLALLISLDVFPGFSQEVKSVLFLGNSYTAVNNLPDLVDQMAQNTGKTLDYTSYTPGGYRFMNHANDPNSLDKINSNAWDYVVLQGQSQETAFPESQLQQEIYPYVNTLVNAIRENDSCSVPLFYMTWGRENGDPTNCEFAPWFCTYEGMDDHIRSTYMTLTQEHHAKVSPVGALWRYLRTNNPPIDLYAGDGSHPSQAGSYAAACAFYTVIYETDPTQITWNSSLSASEAETLRNAAKNVVYDSLSKWDYTLKPEAGFTENIQDGHVDFTNTSTHENSWLWDFGDDSTSTEENPSHTYQENGDYTVTLIAQKCEQRDTVSRVLSIDGALATSDFKPRSLKIYPNPVQESLHIKSARIFDKVTLSIFNLSGRSVLNRSFTDQKTLSLDLSNLPAGLYFISIRDAHQTQVKRIVKK